ncbi:MAG: ABC-F family ATP-binding cassette domain-containing protein [bacterium]|nr:ABC-F family ATP-binding cassette domain-containing protein [bacterium]
MSRSFVQFHTVGFCYESAPEPLFDEVSFHLDRGWSAVVGVNGSGKSTLLKLATGLLEADEGRIHAPQRRLYCPQRTDDMPQDFIHLLAEQSKSAGILKSTLSIQTDWGARWISLSHGERKRVQLATALWQEPDLLAVDEPTNHLDAEARAMIGRALQNFHGVGLLVSHDRELLDNLCRQCLFVEPPTVIVRPGGMTKGMKVAKAEQQSLQKQQDLRKRNYKKLQKEAHKRREEASRANKKRSRRKIPRKDHDAKAKIGLARISGKDAAAGKRLRQLDGRLQQAQEQAEGIHAKKEYATGIWLPDSRSQRDRLLHMPAGTLLLGKEKILSYPELTLRPEDRVALSGLNGTGKSSLIRRIVRSLNVPEEHVVSIPQEIEREQARNILEQARALPHEQLGHLLTVVSRLGSRPQRLLESVEPSPGETRKLLLALGMTRSPHIIVMDEPSNHMDLTSIECLEQALAECPCCLLLVSHDMHFLKKLTRTRWEITKDGCRYENFLLNIVA